MLKIFGLKQCGTTRKALRYLDDRGIPYTFLDIRNTPPSRAELEGALRGPLPARRFFNTSGGAYREGGYKDRVPHLAREQVVDELAREPMLIKRPLVLSDEVTLVGFRQDEYDAVL